MATRWTNRVNPASWITRRRARKAPVAPGGVAEYIAPEAYQTPPQDDYGAVGKAFSGDRLEWFAEAENQPDEFSESIPQTYSLNPARPRTLSAEYDESSSTLRITFREGATYDYAGVTPDMWASLLKERTSTGKWLARNGLAGPGSGIRV